MQKISIYDAAQIIGANNQNSDYFHGVSVDSRLHQQKNLFFALEGAQVDGHFFLKDIATKGAAGAVVKNSYKGPDFGLNLLFVEDPLDALQVLARKILSRSKSRVVAITGSVGKTTTKDFITTLLQEKFNVSASPGNSNSQVGLPLTILNHTTGEEDILVLEMGMTQPGQIKKLISIAPPECAVLTSVALVHACNFQSLEEIAQAKAEVLEHPHTKLGIIHQDIVNIETICTHGYCSKITFSKNNPAADYTLDESNLDRLTIQFQNQKFSLGSFPIYGQHNKVNFLSAVACARYFGMSWEEIATGMSKLTLPTLRGQRVDKKGICFINDSYNASPVSVKAALENLPQPYQGGRKIAVLADMLELGKFSEPMHREIGECALKFVDLLFCYGTESRFILDCWQKSKRPAQWFSSREELLEVLPLELKAGDVVLIKGSRGTQIWKLLDELETLIQ